MAIGDHDRLKQYVIQHPVSEKQNKILLFRYSFKSNFLKIHIKKFPPLKKFHLHILYLNCTCSSIIYWIFFCGGKLDLQQYVRQLWNVSGGNWSSHSNTYTCTGGGNNRTITIHILTILQGPRYDFTGLVIIIKRNQYYVSKAFRNNIRIDFNLILFANL